MMTSDYLYMLVLAFVGWGFTNYIGERIPEPWRKQLPKAAAIVSAALTSGIVSFVQTVSGEPITMDVLLLGLGAGWLAVVGHLFPEVVRGRVTSSEDEP